MAKQERTLAEEYLKTWAKFQDRIEPRDMERIAQSFLQDLERDQSNESPTTTWGWSEADIEKLKGSKLAKDEERDTTDPYQSPPEAEATKAEHARCANAATSEANRENREYQASSEPETSFQLWKPERTAEAGDRLPKSPEDYRLEAISLWEADGSQIAEAIQVFEGTHHEVNHGDIITAPEGEIYLMAPEVDQEVEPLQETNMAKAQDQSKESPDPFQGWTEAQQRRTVEEGLPLVEDRALIERSWAQDIEDRARASLWDSTGRTDELKIMSAGQRSESWTNTIDPSKDMAAVAREMGLTPAIERQKAQEAEQQKGVENAQERGGEGMEH